MINGEFRKVAGCRRSFGRRGSPHLLSVCALHLKLSLPKNLGKLMLLNDPSSGKEALPLSTCKVPMPVAKVVTQLLLGGSLTPRIWTCSVFSVLLPVVPYIILTIVLLNMP